MLHHLDLFLFTRHFFFSSYNVQAYNTFLSKILTERETGKNVSLEWSCSSSPSNLDVLHPDEKDFSFYIVLSILLLYKKKREKKESHLSSHVIVTAIKMKVHLVIFWIFILQINGSFWNEIPSRCIYDRSTLFSCWNTTFIQSIPLFNDLNYTLLNHQVQIRQSNFQLSLIDLFAKVGTNIEYLILIDNTFSNISFNDSMKIYFRLLQTLHIQDQQGFQWFQLNSSYFPQLTELDLSSNQFTNQKQLRFNQQNFPSLKSLDLSHNQLETIDNLTGNRLNRLEILILSFNPLQTLVNQINRFSSLIILDLSHTPIKQLFPIMLLPRLETFHCQSCQQISIKEYERFLSNCSLNLILNLSETKIYSLKSFNSSMECLKNLTISKQEINQSISNEDFLFSTNLEHIQLRSIKTIHSIQLNIYDRLKSIDFSDNKDLQQVQLHPISDYIYLVSLTISHTIMNHFSVDFNRTIQQYLHIDMIDLSDNQLESLDFLQYLIFSSLDLSMNHLKIVSIDQIHFRHGMYELSLMNFFNLSSNQMEFIKIHWDNESPHTIDLSNNNLQSIEFHGQATYTLLLNNNPKLSLTPKTFSLNFPSLQNLDLTATNFNSFESLIYLHNLSNIRTLILNHNQLRQEHRALNWNIFYPWHKSLTHLALRNLSLEKIDPGAYLNDYDHLLTIDFYQNDLKCDCILQPFVQWLKVPPPPSADFYEPVNKVLSLQCPVSIFNMRCDHKQMKSTVLIVLVIVGMMAIVLLMMMMVKLLLRRYRKRKRSEPYDRMLTDNDAMALNETNLTEKMNNEDH